MTANPARPARYRPGKFTAESSSEEDENVEEEIEEHQPPKIPPPKAASFPKQVTTNLQNVDLNERKRQAEREKRKAEWLETRRRKEEREERERMERDAGFITESEEESDDEQLTKQPAPTTTAKPLPKANSVVGSASSSEYDSSSEGSDTSSSSDAPKLIRPTFVKPSNSIPPAQIDALTAASNTGKALSDRKAVTDAVIQHQIDERAALKASAARDWDADDTALADEDMVDDRDGLDPELEHKQWVARELSRLKRDRAALEAREAELAETERRRNLSKAEREEEDRQYLQAQKEARASRGGMAFLQKYQHGGAFYQDDDEAAGLADRDLMGARYVDQVDKEALPEYLRRRDERKVGRKGATRYKDMRSEDTGRFGGFIEEKGRRPTGANAGPLGEKRKGALDGDIGPEREKRVRVER